MGVVGIKISKRGERRKYLPLEIRAKMYEDVIELKRQGLTAEVKFKKNSLKNIKNKYLYRIFTIGLMENIIHLEMLINSMKNLHQNLHTSLE
jgi:hypothetical protein